MFCPFMLILSYFNSSDQATFTAHATELLYDIIQAIKLNFKHRFQAVQSHPWGCLQVLINICVFETRESTGYLSIPQKGMLQHE